MSIPRLKAEVFAEADHALGEGPLWFEERWWWTDIEAGAIHSRDAQGGGAWKFDFGRKVTAFAPAEGRHLLVAFERTLVLWDRESGETQTVASLEGEPHENRFNDGKRDPFGRFLIGTLSKVGARGSAGLYVLEESGSLRRLRDGVHLSNGLAWSAEGKTLYHVDSLAHEITAFDYDPATSRLSGGRVVVRVPDGWGLPDGMDIDSDGNLWIAHWGGGAVRCWSPQTGECLREIMLPCSQPTSCFFGGPRGRDLLITSARTGLSEADLASQPLAGSVWIYREA